MRLEPLRWVLLPLAALDLLIMIRSGATPGRAAFFAFCALGWYALSRRKALSLDHRDAVPGRPKD